MDTIEMALAELAAGRPTVVVDSERGKAEGCLIAAADRISTATMSFIVRHSSGFVCVALPSSDCDRLTLPPMHLGDTGRDGTAYRVTVDAAAGTGTGISGHDRALTARLLAAATTQPGDLSRPGHVVPLAARPGGVFERSGHTEAAVDLTRLAGLRPSGVLGEVVSEREPTRMARLPELEGFAAKHDLAIVSVEALIAHRRATETSAERVATRRLPTATGAFETVSYRSFPDGAEHIAFVVGDAHGPDTPVHIHVECVPGSVFGSLHCECARRLDEAVRAVTSARCGIVIYLRPNGSGAASALLPHDDAAAHASPADSAVAAAIMSDLGVTSVRHVHSPPFLRGALDNALQTVLGATPHVRTGAVA